jgi:alkylation response protein AidB-like acyl-CoA dehydrogenase
VLGLQGTASVDYNIVEQFVDQAFGFALPDPVALRPHPSYQLGLGPTGAAGHGAVAIGIAMRAFEELAGIVSSKRRPGFPGIIDQQLFLHDFASKEASMQAARTLFFSSFQSAYDTAVSGSGITILQKQRLRQAVTHATNVAADVVRWCYTWARSDSLRNPSALGRCLRDISAATQHVFVDHNTLVAVAPDLLADWTK